MLDGQRTTGILGLTVAGLAIAASVAGYAPTAQAADRDAIWKIVHDQCQPNAVKSGNPAPCAELQAGKDGKGGFAILKDRKGQAHYLLIPTEPISGIESPDLLRPDAENWFARAWQARRFLDEAAHRAIPPDDVALAINSVAGRGQDQLHIHISCIDPAVERDISRQSGKVADSWSRQDITLKGNRYYARRVDRPNLDGFDPFRQVADGIPGAKDDMGRMTILVVGAGKDRGGGFLVFAGRSDRASGDRGKAEDLLDDNCARIDN